MSHPTIEDARRLAEWTPRLGVVSVYLRLDPGDRGGAWRTELGNGLAAVRERASGLEHEAAVALRATVERIEERLANHERDLPRAELGFVEVAAKPAEERWWPGHVAPISAPVAGFGERPLVGPLVCLLERAAPRGAALLSAERVRLCEWAPGHLEELHAWEMTIFSGDWRERKAQRVADPARGQAVSASGHDQFDERLQENRHRFLSECGGLTGPVAAQRDWGQLLVFGTAEHEREFRQGFASGSLALEHAGDADLISEPAARLEAEVAAATARLDDERERRLVERMLEEARGGSRACAGRQETEAALAEARVERLVLDAACAGGCEEMVRTALASGAEVTGVSEAGAELLTPVDGVAALLRY